MDAAVALRRRPAGTRRARRRHRRRMVAALLHRRDRRAGPRLRAGTNPADGRPWTMVTDKLSPKKPGFIAARGDVPEAGSPAGRSRSTLPAPALLGERMWDPRTRRRPIRRATTSCATACRSCARSCELLRDDGRGRSCRSTIRTSACSSIPTCAPSTTIPTEAADFAVDMINQVVDGFDGMQAGRPPLPPRRRPGARREHHARAATNRSSSSSTGSR